MGFTISFFIVVFIFKYAFDEIISLLQGNDDYFQTNSLFHGYEGEWGDLKLSPASGSPESDDNY